MTDDAKFGAIAETRSYEDAGGKRRLSLATRSDLGLNAQVIASGATWIDRQLLVTEPATSSAGFGAELRGPMNARVEHLVEEDLPRRQGQRIVFARNLLSTLRQREFHVVQADDVIRRAILGEWRGGVAPPRSHRTGREPLGSS
jgi:hypothetical protein